jgi:hypothetical protein
MKFDIRKYVDNPDNPSKQYLFNSINDLVNIAGHITIRQLFAEPKYKYTKEVQDVICKAFDAKILAFGNGRCWDKNSEKCMKSEDSDWCSITNSGDYTLASTPCKKGT